ncbi:MAG TPA: GNAT family N-acetyltransferase [Xanthomonadales bacterium]|nr:GNAT family N-acetyltransferase [Xanthomonadales bacterium]
MSSHASVSIEVRQFADADYARLPEMFAWLEPDLPAATVLARIPPMQAQGWRCVGAFAGDQLIGMAGFGARHHLFSGPVMYVENVAVLPDWRTHGIGVRLMRWIEALARQSGCNKITLDAYAVNAGARAFYQRLGYDPRGVHFVLDL